MRQINVVSTLQRPNGFETINPSDLNYGDEFLVVHEHSMHFGCVRYAGIDQVYQFDHWTQVGLAAYVKIVGSVGRGISLAFPVKQAVDTELESAIDRLRDESYELDESASESTEFVEEIPSFCFLVTPHEYLRKQIPPRT